MLAQHATTGAILPAVNESELFVKKIFVGNLDFSTTEDELRQLFAQHGKVDGVSLITDQDTGRSRGFAFVEMPNSEEARRSGL
jgi:RNA recognition motif-containing protein